MPPNNIHDLHFMIRVSIENSVTLQLMKRALDAKGVDLMETGVRLDTCTDEGRASLGAYPFDDIVQHCSN